MVMFIILQLLFVGVASNAASSIPLCRPHEREALLAFKMAFTVSTCQGDAYPKTDSWKHGSFDCCRWDGITCDPSSGHVTELELSCNILSGRFPSNSSLFHLRHLRHLNLAENNFSAAPIPPDFGRLSNLEYLNLSRSGFNGQVPRDIGWLSKLTSLDFSYLFNVKMSSFKTIVANLTSLRELDLSSVTIGSDLPPRITKLSKLESLRLANCSLQGELQEAIFGLRNLVFLELQENNLTGTIPLSKLLKLQNLDTLLLSHNSLSVVDDVGAESTSFFPRMTSLGLSSCSLGHFPNFLRKQKNLTELQLSNNGINDVVPGWLIDVSSLQILDLSYNSLTGGLENLQSPVPSAIPSSLCHLSHLQLLDLSHNNLTGYIPECFTYFISQNLEILNLKKNKLQGIIPSIIFENCPRAMTISLSGNLLEGSIPHTLGNCRVLKLLDVCENKLNGTFPHGLNVLPYLEVLIIGTNNLQGHLPSFNTTNSFLKLRILDFSNNEFTGALPSGLLMSFKAMMSNNPPQDQLYMGSYYSHKDSITAWVKGLYRELHGILDNLFLLDASRNRLEGHIPEAIGNLVALRWLNLADNNFTGVIPPSLGKLRLLESLDLSINGLDGHIPSELVNLNFLGFFNVSENNLVGPVPTGKQFNTFLDNSYIGNPRLCGELLRKKCRINDEPPTSTPAEENDSGSSSFHLWEIVLMGFGSGLFVGLVWGYFMFWEREYYWVDKLIFKIEVFILLCLGRQSRRN